MSKQGVNRARQVSGLFTEIFPGAKGSVLPGLVWLCMAASLIHPSLSATAQSDQVHIVLEETLKFPDGRSPYEAVWWIPVEFWRLSWPEPDEAEASLQRFRTLEVLEQFELIVLSHREPVAQRGQESPSSPQVSLEGWGKMEELRPSAQSDLLRAFLEKIRPMVANVLDATPSQLTLHLYQLPPSFLEARASGRWQPCRLLAEAADKSMVWAYPPQALRPARHCPVDDHPMAPGWHYCPWHGQPLQESHSPGQ